MSALRCSAPKTSPPIASYPKSARAADDRVRNPVPRPADGVLKTPGRTCDLLRNKAADTVPAMALPVDWLTRAQIEASPGRSRFRPGSFDDADEAPPPRRGVMLSHDPAALSPHNSIAT